MIAMLTAGLLAAAMPPTEQNALVQRYCTVCHTDKSMNGGLSLEHFDAARPDPGDAAMIISKMKSGAFSAAGIPAPDKTKQDALIDALSASAAGATRWTFKQATHPATGFATLTASIVQGVPSSANHGEPDLYRLTLTCLPAAREAEMQLAWSPNVPASGQKITAVVDGTPAVGYTIEGTERMGNGTSGTSGPGSIILKALPLPAQRLAISNVFPDQTVVFPFGLLPEDVRQQLAVCFGR
jgi:hypothetical protein